MRNILLCIILTGFMNSCKDATPATYYLPKDFEGVFAVVYSQKQRDNKIINGRRQLYVPDNRILMTSFDFSDGWRDDIFLIKSTNGYDTLKMFLPNKDTTGKKFDRAYYKMYTNDINAVAINFRQIVNSVPINTTDGNCKFEYELITVGKAATLNDSLGKVFKAEVNQYLESLCKKNRVAP